MSPNKEDGTCKTAKDRHRGCSCPTRGDNGSWPSLLQSKAVWAYAPSAHTYGLEGKWKRFTGRVGALDGSGNVASVQFQVVSEGKILWSSQVVRVGEIVDFDIDVTGIKTIKLETRDGGNDPNEDWGHWLDPRLERLPNGDHVAENTLGTQHI